MLDVLAPSHAVDEFDAVLVGFDVEGFSRTVEKATLLHGRVAGELAAQRILAGERIATILAREAGLRFADALGDGAVYLRAQAAPTGREARALLRLQEELKYAHLRETGLAVRTAWAHGAVRLMRPAAPILEHGEVLLGPAVAKLHAGLSRRPRARRPTPEPPADRPDLTSREGEIADMTFVYLRLCRGEAWAELGPDRLDDVLGLIGHWAERRGGRLERITQDEKGVHVRVGLRGVSAADRDWRETLLEPQRALIGLGFDGAVAAAGGPVYRGPSEHGSTIVHGGAVNRAAKLCAAEPPGGLGVDTSLLGASGPTSPVRDRGIGRREESGQAAAWLASGAPRMAILSGEMGIGKSHLLRAKLAGSEAAIRGFVSGAPARMLDPLGAWFELVSQAMASRRPYGDDAAWASRILAEAGLDPVALALCARALRGVDGAGYDQTAALSGAERAALTRQGMLALIGAIARVGQWLVVMDDLQDVDEASLALTLAVLDGAAPVRILAAARTPLGDDRLARLRGHLSTLEVPLPPLTARQVEDLVDLSGAAGIDAAEVMAISAGNPFRAVQAALALAGDDGAGELTLTSILDRRLDRLDVDEREVLAAVSIADRSWRAADIAVMAPTIAGQGLAAEVLERLARETLIVADAGDARAFHAAHRLLAETVRRRMPAGVRRRLAEGAARRPGGSPRRRQARPCRRTGKPVGGGGRAWPSRAVVRAGRPGGGGGGRGRGMRRGAPARPRSLRGRTGQGPASAFGPLARRAVAGPVVAGPGGRRQPQRPTIARPGRARTRHAPSQGERAGRLRRARRDRPVSGRRRGDPVRHPCGGPVRRGERRACHHPGPGARLGGVRPGADAAERSRQRGAEAG